MKILAFDTSTRYLSIAVFDGASSVSSYHEDVGIEHSRILVPRIDEIIKGAGWNICEVDTVAVGIGPGSFTGLRIGVSTAKGIAAACGNKVIGIPTMDVIARGVKGCAGGPLGILLDARKGKVYSCIYGYKKGTPDRLSEYGLSSVGDLMGTLKSKVTFVGDAVEKYKAQLDMCEKADYITDCNWYPNAKDLGLIAEERIREAFDKPHDLEPLYLHPKECNITVAKKDNKKNIESRKSKM